MDDADDGFFYYDQSFPPLFVRPPVEQEPACRFTMNYALNQYLRDSFKRGVRHHLSVLPTGLTAGEAAILYLRREEEKQNGATPHQQNQKHTQEKQERIHMLIRQLMEGLRIHMSIHFTRETEALFRQHVHHDLFLGKQYTRNLRPAIKAFIRDLGLNQKGYTSKLQPIWQETDELVSNLLSS